MWDIQGHFKDEKGFKESKIGFFWVNVLNFLNIYLYSNHMHSSFIGIGLLKVIISVNLISLLCGIQGYFMVKKLKKILLFLSKSDLFSMAITCAHSFLFYFNGNSAINDNFNINSGAGSWIMLVLNVEDSHKNWLKECILKKCLSLQPFDPYLTLR